ncbi:MAG: TrmH family RNA methyltransferase [Candidatus Merdivicinus sp.]|jgi:TrmH family RNA methyltransferase
MERIESKDNARVKEYVKAASMRKFREQSGKFVLEGGKLLEEAVRSGIRVERIFVSENYWERHPETVKCGETFLISEAVETRISQSQTPQGVYALCKKLDKPENLDKIDSNGSYIALWDLQDPGNVGTIIRGADAMGLSGVFVSRGCCDLYNLKTLRAAMGSLFRMPVYEVEMKQFLAETPLRSYAAVVDADAQPVIGVDFRGAVAVIGNEGRGLSLEQADACSGKMTIPMRGNAESLNAAMAATILMWEMARAAL